jgi:hypothetical protein
MQVRSRSKVLLRSQLSEAALTASTREPTERYGEQWPNEVLSLANIPSALQQLHGNFPLVIGSLRHCLMLSLWSNRNQPAVRSALLLRRPDEAAPSSLFLGLSPRQVQSEQINCCSMGVAQLAMLAMCCLR